ncbi:hypothetical protein [Bradyrhizobium sp. CCGUVB23]|uniref:hypothetical protein n=1 Tax=Bradyrhizobium sp. CCGUVB23 TaxID=2949630 RepID=UPI0020B1BDAE|nr:hypothetical protein [Bradyrhizobium sp. CCGUVB23]MCP3460119.1 hypothetical protein [Bradyrhizobium sp. CCGUVB23]
MERPSVVPAIAAAASPALAAAPDSGADHVYGALVVLGLDAVQRVLEQEAT